ncbi:hypothetical protein IC582_022278 [Cucumis melo]
MFDSFMYTNYCAQTSSKEYAIGKGRHKDKSFNNSIGFSFLLSLCLYAYEYDLINPKLYRFLLNMLPRDNKTAPPTLAACSSPSVFC